jgi:hypothetical protein
MDEITPDKLEAISLRIEEAASEYRQIAQKMRQMGITSLSVTGFDTLQKATLPRLESPAGSVRRALKSAMSTNPLADVISVESQINAKNKGKKKS